MKHCMVDLETVSLNNNAALLSIGAVKFDKDGLGEEFYMRILVESCQAVGLHTCTETLAWWDKQDPKTRTEAFGGKAQLVDVLMEFATWLGSGMQVWGNGACADNIWLANAYKAVGVEVPWKYWNDRCYRTVKAMLPPRKTFKPKVAHHALSDAQAQAKTLINCFATHGVRW